MPLVFEVICLQTFRRATPNWKTQRRTEPSRRQISYHFHPKQNEGDAARLTAALLVPLARSRIGAGLTAGGVGPLVRQAQDLCKVPASRSNHTMSSTAAKTSPSRRARHHHRRAHLTTGQLRGCAARLITQFEGACSRPLMKEVAICTEEMRRQKLESFGASPAEAGDGGQSAGPDLSWTEVSALAVVPRVSCMAVYVNKVF